MKKVITLLFIISAAQTFAQQSEDVVLEKKQKHEINYNIYSGFFENRSFPGDDQVLAVYRYNYNHRFFSGMQYKFNFRGNHWLRSGIGFSQSGGSSSYYFEDFYGYYEGNKNAFAVNAGYEYVFLSKRIQPYVFADIEYSYISEKGKMAYAGPLICIEPIPDIPYLHKTNQIGGHAGAGIKFNICKNFVIGIETAVGSAYFNTNDKYDEADYTGTSYKFYPIRSFNLGLKF